eukprot:CAMPEP_0201988178 /NCGR_PEP_ID=MMETSP0904-20121228/92187_1 /ASSEMBLY_ACC=CAM_ASM_000553 /TAXON_ID=420261 /ORGANISM="Thalassiosira antarctica, Strain CCMP982" /LENGTH=149 /DNA_ID=CAMNT_0048542329 /DNA_START=645 /DNA_END=1095 /DNA_ORIENTATION=+
MTISTTNTRDDTDTVNDILSKDSTGIRNELWKSATETDNNGPIKAVDYYLCSYSVVHMTSRNDAASKKLLNDKSITESSEKASRSNDILSKDSTGIRNELWKSATETDNNGPIKAVDYYLCSYSVVHMTSRNDAASKKLLNDIINHGEF